MLIYAIITAFILSFSNANAVETDQYMTWDITLKDSRVEIEEYIETNIQSVLDSINSKNKNYSCQKMTKKLLGWNGKSTNFLSEIEDYMYRNKTIDRHPKIYQSVRGIVDKSIYKDVEYFKVKVFGISLMAYDVYFGIDKLGHFLTTGLDYYKKYIRYINRGYSVKKSEIKAIKKGIFSEKTYYGLIISGVFSFADLEANYQGLKFARSFCEGESPLIKKVNNKWKLTRKISLKNYINPNWDESFYTNSFTKKRFRQVLPYLTEYCKKRDLPIVIERKNLYNSRVQSNLSTKYLEKLKSIGKIKNNKKYSLDTICK